MGLAGAKHVGKITLKSLFIYIFIDFWSLLIVLEFLELFYVNLLTKTYLLVPNLCLYDLMFKN